MTARHLLLLLFLPASGCVGYTADRADAATIAGEIAQRHGGRFTFAEAVRTSFRQNAELRQLEALARAAGAVVEPTGIQSEYRSDFDMLAVMVDPVAMLNLGARGAANSEARAETEAAAVALAAGRWRIAGQLAEVYEVARTLGELTVPALAVDADAFARAGLASPVAAAQVRAAAARAQAERIALDSARADNLAEFRRLLGLPAEEPVELVPPAAGWLPEPSGRKALLARPDLAVAAARFRTADAAYRRAVQDQYPSLMIGPEFSLIGDPMQTMAVLRIPVAAQGRARAAQQRRDAARAGLEAALLAADRDASAADTELRAAESSASAASAGQQASASALRSALVALQTETDAFGTVADAAAMTMRETMERRQSALLLARARVRRAVAWGWPAEAL